MSVRKRLSVRLCVWFLFQRLNVCVPEALSCEALCREHISWPFRSCPQIASHVFHTLKVFFTGNNGNFSPEIRGVRKKWENCSQTFGTATRVSREVGGALERAASDGQAIDGQASSAENRYSEVPFTFPCIDFPYVGGRASPQKNGVLSKRFALLAKFINQV